MEAVYWNQGLFLVKVGIFCGNIEALLRPIYVYMYTYIYVYIYMYTYICIHIYIYIYVVNRLCV